MTLSLQVFIIALLISLLLGVIVGYLLRQGRVRQLTQSLKQSQKRQEALEQEHEERLQQATLQLQQDYQGQLAEKIERYQDQLEERATLLEQEYQDRLGVLDQGRQIETPEYAQASTEAISPGPSLDIPADVQYIEQQIKRQYEDRLKEAARKIQQAYEQHLQQKLKESRDFFQKDYENRLIQKIEHYETQVTNRIEQLQAEYDLRLQSLTPHSPATVSNQPTPGSLDTTATFSLIQPQTVPPVVPAFPSSEPTAAMTEEQVLALENRLREEYEQKLAEKIEHYQDDLVQRVQSLEEEYETRLHVSQQAQTLASRKSEVPSVGTVSESNLREEYEQKLAEKIERYQDDLAQRTQGLEEEYENRLQVMQQGQSTLNGQSTPSGNSGNALLDLTEPFPGPNIDDALNPLLPDMADLPAPLLDLEAGPDIDTPFSLDQILLAAEASAGSDQSLDLDNEFDASAFNLDELLFDQTEESSEDGSPSPDDVNRRS